MPCDLHGTKVGDLANDGQPGHPDLRDRIVLERNFTPSTLGAEDDRPATVPFTVVDGCGEWPTFVGGGPSAF